jgi:acetyl esterase/lipase
MSPSTADNARIDTTGIDPELAAFVPHLPDLSLDDPLAARAAGVELVRRAAAAAGPPNTSGLTLTEVAVSVPGGPDLAVTLTAPAGAAGPLPAVVLVHGGGFVMGDRAAIAGECLALARRLGVVVANPEYRLAPEHPFPAAVDDVHALLVHLAGREDVDPARIAVAGSSAGAAIAAGATLAARERGGPALAMQVLDNPALDDRLTSSSMRQFTATPMWDRRKCEQMWDLYLGPERGAEVSPLAAAARAHDLSGLPPTYLMVAQFDPLRDEGLAYAGRLMEAGVPVELHAVPGAFHGFTSLPTALSRRVLDWRTAALARALDVQVAPLG